MASWTFVLTDQNFVPQGEVLNAAERKVAEPLDKLPTASMKLRLDNPLADLAMTTACYLKGYRWITGIAEPQFRFFGPVVSAEESADQQNATVALNAVGGGWVFQKRLVGKSALGTTWTTTDRARIVADPSISPVGMIPTSDGEGETHIDFATGPYSAASTATYTATYKTILDAITDLSVGDTGFDWRVVPVENYVNGTVVGPKIGRFEAYPLIGTPQSNAVFEWGTGRRNIASYTRSVDRSTQADKVYHNASAGPDAPGFPTVSAIDADAITEWGLLEDLAQADLLDPTLRQNIVNQHVRVRKNPRQLISFTPHIDPSDTGRLPQFGIEYDVGDTVRARAVYEGRLRFDVAARVWGVTFDINELGIEQQTLQLAQE
jgi:hypothetical protein